MAQGKRTMKGQTELQHGRSRTGPSRRGLLGMLGAAGAAIAAPPALAQRLAGFAPPRQALLPLAPNDGTYDVLHGVRIEDPFRPLEDATRPDVQEWVAALDQEARGVLEGNPVHARVIDFLRAAGRYRRATGNRRLGSQLVARIVDGDSEQSWLAVRDSADQEWRPLIDPNTMGSDGSVSLATYFVDRLSEKVAYLTTENGGDQQTLRIRDIRMGVDFVDRLVGCRFTSVVWLPDGRSFYYVRPPLPGERESLDRASHAIYMHRLGSLQSNDRLVWRVPKLTNVSLGLRAIYATNLLMVTARIGTDERIGVWAGPMLEPSDLKPMVPMGLASFNIVQSLGNTHYAITDHEAPRGRIVRVSQTDPKPSSWQTIVPESDALIDGATIVSSKLLVRSFKDLGHQLTIHDLEGRRESRVPVDGGSRIAFERGERSSPEILLDIDDRRRPMRQFRLNVLTARAVALPDEAPPHTLEDCEIHQLAAASPDGTEVPVSIMHLPGLKRNGENRTLLTGYGSYGLSQLPGYSGLAAAWIRLGGVYAVASIRGGSEYGREWHEAGRLERKPNALADFWAAAELLVQDGITRREKLGIYGASSGGRLVLGSLVNRPELFGAVVAGVPLVDMLRFHKHTFGIAWTQEYGNPDRPEDFKWLRALSPLHNIKPGVVYPPLMILTADNDQRVVPSHSYKFAATLMRASPQSEVHVRTRRGAGHGAGNSLSKSIEFQADIVSFLSSRLGGPLRELPRLKA